MFTESQRKEDEAAPASEPATNQEAQTTPTSPTLAAPKPEPAPVPIPQPEPALDFKPDPEPTPLPQPDPVLEPPQSPTPEPVLPPSPEPIVEPPPQLEEPEAATLLLRHPVPGAVVTQWFGKNADFYKKWGLAGHEGIDFGCRTGTAVAAASAGKVIICGPSPDDGPLGTRVVLEHRWGDARGYSIYAHLSEIADGVTVGSQVVSGDNLGESGDTGNVTGPHLHFALLLKDQALEGFRGPRNMGAVWWHDPKPYIAEFQVAGIPGFDDEIDHDHICGGPPILEL